ncbi:MAG: hypothetical protein HY326_03865 [Chloroflexi bacterium]|nr:hypothetical protein [Chloroflexota bacterium]
MKVVVIGGGSQSTPTLFQYLATVGNLPDLHFVLASRSSTHLSAVARAARLLLPAREVRVECVAVQDLDLRQVLPKADVVLVQLRAGGYAARTLDETFPLKYGICGDEVIGPGGLSAAWRAWPYCHRILQQVEALAPSAKVVLLSSPPSLLVRCSAMAFPGIRSLGICELPWTTLSDICNALGVPAHGVSFGYYGINHLGWFHQITVGSRDLVEEYAITRLQSDAFPSHELISGYGGIPTKYLEYHFHQEQVVAEQRLRKKARGEALAELEQTAFSVFQDGSLEEIEGILRHRPAPWYPYAIGPLLLGWAGYDVNIPFFLSLANQGCYPDLFDDDILESPYRLRDGMLQRVESKLPVPDPIAGLTHTFVAYERIAAQAVYRGDPGFLAAALRSHPWSRVADQAEVLAGEMIASR